jgi:hypothetical protein
MSGGHAAHYARRGSIGVDSITSLKDNNSDSGELPLDGADLFRTGKFIGRDDYITDNDTNELYYANERVFRASDNLDFNCVSVRVFANKYIVGDRWQNDELEAAEKLRMSEDSKECYLKLKGILDEMPGGRVSENHRRLIDEVSVMQ